MTDSRKTVAGFLSDEEARRRIAGDLDTTCVVEAAAGTGKTTALVRRMRRMLETGHAAIGDLAAVTFTEKAAGELKLRLRQELEEARHDAGEADSRARLDAALRSLEDARISTIHGFCADLLRERPVEAGIDPLFLVLTETQARREHDDAFEAWLQSALEDPPEGIRRALRRPAPRAGADDDEDGPVARLRQASWTLAEWRDFPAMWSRPAFDRAATIGTVAASLSAFAAMTAQPANRRDPLFEETAAARRASAELAILLGADPDLDGAEAVLVDLARDWAFRRPRRGAGPHYAPDVARADVCAAHEALVAQIDAFRLEADADLAACVREDLRAALAAYEARKQRAGALDFLDLLLRARDLVRDRDGVRAALQQRFACLFVDEFQDTDPLQAELLLLLAADDPRERDWTRTRPRPGALFIVGDPKQSIYRFRRADVAVHQQVVAQLVAAGARSLQLTTSFRSVPALQRVINAAFAPIMTGDSEVRQASYVPLAPSRDDRPTQPSFVALPVPEPYGRRRLAASAIERSLPDAVGAFLDWLVHESGWTVTERRGGDPVAIRPRHVCLLFRRFVHYDSDMARPYVDALEARGLPHLLVGGRVLHGREEVETLRAALTAVEWPDDELSVFATLRGALFAFGDEELLEYRHVTGRPFHPFRVPGGLPPALEPIGDALALLGDLHRDRNRHPVAATVTHLLDATRAHVGFALRRAGEQVLANVLQVAELARQYELQGGLSFRGFVEALHDAAGDRGASDAPIVEEDSEGVRLMTVHRAKGLEFPVVVLADITAKLAPPEAARYLDATRGLCALRLGGWSPHDLVRQQALEQAREREEGIRLAYVAATRARDLLIVPAVGDAPWESGWTSPLNGAIYPPEDHRRSSVAAPGCPAFGRDSVLRRPDEGISTPLTVSPGLHRLVPRAGGAGTDEAAPFDVVWWDPRALRLGADAPFGLRREELISKDVEPGRIAEGGRAHTAWRAARDEAVTRGGVPSVRVETVTAWVHRQDRHAEPGSLTGAPFVEEVAIDGEARRPGGQRFGTLVHAALAVVPLDADARVVETVVATQARILAAPDEERRTATTVVCATLRHPILEAARDAARSGRCHRELPMTNLIDGTLVEGMADLVYEQGEGLVVVDFKTDRPEGALRDRYRRQVALYAGALALATGRRVQAVLLTI